MSGHSKWSTIKHKKAITDAKRSKGFTKLIKEITVAARAGGGDPAGNPHLRLLLDKARDINMPLDNAMRAIKRGTGELPGVNYEAQTYEGYGPHGIAVIVDVLTDNKNRSVAELRHAFTAKGGSLAENGAVSWMFEKMGVIKGNAGKTTEDELLELLLEYDTKDITLDDGSYFINCDARSLMAVKQVLTNANINVESAELEWVAGNTLDLDENGSNQAVEFLSTVEDLEDVQNVYTNLG